MRIIVEHDGKLYEWVEYSTPTCYIGCHAEEDSICQQGDDLWKLCESLREIVGSHTSHRFRRIE